MAKIEIRGDIIPNDDKEFYEWFGWDGTCPRDVQTVLDSADIDEVIEVTINSGGGDVFAGQEIYSKLQKYQNVQVEVQSVAASAASLIAMVGHCKISPIGVIMVHNVSMYYASGDYRDMEKNAEILKRLNQALAGAYVNKTGKSMDEVLKLMDDETWLTAGQCLEHGFVDEIATEQPQLFTNGLSCSRMTEELRQKVRDEKNKKIQEQAKRELLDDLYLYGI